MEDLRLVVETVAAWEQLAMRAPGLLVHAEHEHLDADARWLEWLPQISIESGGQDKGTRCCGCSPAISTTWAPCGVAVPHAGLPDATQTECCDTCW